MEFRRIGILSMWENVITAFTDVIYEFIVDINENSTVAKIKVAIKVLKTIFRHEMNRIKQMFYDKKTMITVNDDVTRDTIHVKRTRDLPSEFKNDSVKLRKIFHTWTWDPSHIFLYLSDY